MDKIYKVKATHTMTFLVKAKNKKEAIDNLEDFSKFRVIEEPKAKYIINEVKGAELE